MIIRVKHDELNKVKDVMKNDSNSLDQEIENLASGIEKLKTVWQGPDANIFCDNVTNYLSKMRQVPECMRTLSDFIYKVNNQYKESDEAFSRDLQTEVDNYETNSTN